MPLLSLLAATSKVDAVTFIIGAVIILGGAIGVVMARNPVHAALLLVQTLFGVAVLFVAQGAHFLAAVQVIVYAGAIVVLFLFVIMLLGVDKEEMVAAEPLRNQMPVAVIVVLITAAELLLLGRRRNWATGAPSVVGTIEGPGTQRRAPRRSDLHPLPVRVRSHLGPAGHRGGRRGGARPPPRRRRRRRRLHRRVEAAEAEAERSCGRRRGRRSRRGRGVAEAEESEEVTRDGRR